MSNKKLVVAVIAGVVSMALPAFSQSEDPGKNEVSVQAFGSFVKSSTNNGIENKATNSGGVRGNYRRFFDVHNGVEVNYGYALNTQNFNSAGGTLGVKSYSHEFSAAYVLRMPMRRFTPFVLEASAVSCLIRRIFREPIHRRVPPLSTAAEPISTSRIMCLCAPNIAASSTTRRHTICRAWTARIVLPIAPSRR